MRVLFVLITISFIVTCKVAPKTKPSKSIDMTTEQSFPILKYYNPDFILDSLSKLRTEGYYEVKEIFGSYTEYSGVK